MKSQVLADFFTDFPQEIANTKDEAFDPGTSWRLYVDSTSNEHMGGVGIVHFTLEGLVI